MPKPGSESTDSRHAAEHRTDRVILALGLILSVAGFAWLISLISRIADNLASTRGISCAVYGSALVLMYLCSTLYHWMPDHRPRSTLRILDHSAIYVLIAGTYTPFTLPNIPAAWALESLILVWALAVAGITFKLLWIGRADRISLFFYLAMGWSVLLIFKPLSTALPTAVLSPLIAGGILYTLGSIIYASKHLPYRLPIWHTFVIAASTTHYVAIARYLV